MPRTTALTGNPDEEIWYNEDGQAFPADVYICVIFGGLFFSRKNSSHHTSCMQKVKPRIVEVEPQGRCVSGVVTAISVINNFYTEYYGHSPRWRRDKAETSSVMASRDNVVYLTSEVHPFYMVHGGTSLEMLFKQVVRIASGVMLLMQGSHSRDSESDANLIDRLGQCRHDRRERCPSSLTSR